MIRRSSPVLALVTLLGLLTALPVGPAVAAEVRFADARHDAPARYDLTRVSVRNDRDRVSIRLGFADLRRGEQVVGASIASVRAELYWHVTTVVRRSGRVTARLTTLNGSKIVRVRCDVVGTWRFRADAVRMSFPQSCLDLQRAVRVSVFAGAGDGSAGDPADWTRTVRVPYA